jgi:hypothetical protein
MELRENPPDGRGRDPDVPADGRASGRPAPASAEAGRVGLVLAGDVVVLGRGCAAPPLEAVPGAGRAVLLGRALVAPDVGRGVLVLGGRDALAPDDAGRVAVDPAASKNSSNENESMCCHRQYECRSEERLCVTVRRIVFAPPARFDRCCESRWVGTTLKPRHRYGFVA